METTIIWEDPTPSAKRSLNTLNPPEKSMVKYKGYVDELKTRPNTWAVFKRASSPTYSTRLKNAYPGVETVCRRVLCEDGKVRFDVYARWVG